jgi:hypothetical protein
LPQLIINNIGRVIFQLLNPVNKTVEWLKYKTEIERKEMIATAQKDMANFKCTFQKRKAEIARKRKQAWLGNITPISTRQLVFEDMFSKLC